MRTEVQEVRTELLRWMFGFWVTTLRWKSLFKALNEDGGRYVPVGGLAVVLHGHLRATGDVDLVVDLAPDQVAVRVAALDDLIELKRRAGRPEDLADAEALTEIQRLRGKQP